MGLWIKNEDGSVEKAAGGGGSGDGGPHDHDDYLPLTGGTLTGNLQVDGQVSTPSRFVGNPHGNYSVPPYSFAGRETTGVFAGVDFVGFTNDGNYKLVCYNTHTLVTTDLQVDGQINFSDRAAGPIVNLYVGSDGSNNYGFGLSADLVAFWAGGKQVGGFDSVGNLYLDGAVLATRGIAFGIADGINTADVLDRAETATMPIVDDEGVATTDVETITVNEVMTAMLAKIKELSARIEELEGN